MVSAKSNVEHPCKGPGKSPWLDFDNKAKMRMIRGHPMEELLKNFLIRQLSIRPAVVVSENTSLEEAVNSMREKKSGSVLTQDRSGKITGIFTERDLLYKVVAQPVSWKSSVKEFCTPNPVTLGSDETVHKALACMRKGNFRRIPIVETDGKIRGMLSLRGLVRLLAEHFPTEIMNLPPQPHGHLKTPEGG